MSAAADTDSTSNRSGTAQETAADEPVNTFGAITRARRDVEERIATLVADDPAILEQINDLLDELDSLRIEWGKRTKIRTSADERQRAERMAVSGFARTVPSKVITKAEARLRKAMSDVLPKSVSLAEVEEAMFELQVAHGYGTARYVMTTRPFQAFREQVAHYIGLRAEANGSIDAQQALGRVADDVLNMMPMPPAPDEDDIL